jgi:hypothetical protein
MTDIPWQLKRRLNPKIHKWKRQCDEIASYPAPFNSDVHGFFLSRVREELQRWAGSPVATSLEYCPRHQAYSIQFSAAGTNYEFRIV